MELDNATPLKVPKWLKRIQENSWEAEILISGGAIFTLIQSSEHITRAGILFKENYSFKGLDQSLIFITLAVSGLTIGFILHLLIRGYWVGLVCMNSAFPAGIKQEKLVVADIYKKQTTNYNIAHHITRVDNLSGLIFFSAIVFFLFVIGTLIHTFTFFFVANELLGFVPYVFWVLLTIYCLHYLDLFTFGTLLRNRFIGKYYYPVYFVNQYASLSFLYRLPLQQLTSNIHKLTLVAYIFCFVGMSLLVSYESLRTVLHLKDVFDQHKFTPTLNAESYWDNFYMDRPSEKIQWASIQSDLIKDNHLVLFVPYRPAYDNSIEQTESKSFDAIVRIELNNQHLDSIDWHTYLNTQTSQQGIIAHIPIFDLPKGKNSVRIYIDDEYLTSKFTHITIPFWKE